MGTLHCQMRHQSERPSFINDSAWIRPLFGLNSAFEKSHMISGASSLAS
jgi:hypothetical protein